MNHKQPLSDELLNAFVDNELDQEDTVYVQGLIENDADIRRRVDELRSIKNLLNASYPVASGSTGDRSNDAALGFGKFIQYGIAACLLIGVGVLVGLSLDSITPLGQPQGYQTTAIGLSQKPETVKVLFHLNRDDAAGFQQILNQVESLLAEYQNKPDQLHIEIVANGTGLNLYRADNVRFAAKIQKFRKAYNNVAFLGCQNTYLRLSRETGKEIILLPEINMVALGISHVLRRQRSGWAYIQA